LVEAVLAEVLEQFLAEALAQELLAPECAAAKSAAVLRAERSDHPVRSAVARLGSVDWDSAPELASRAVAARLWGRQLP